MEESPRPEYGSYRRRFPYGGPCWSGASGTYYVTPEVIELLYDMPSDMVFFTQSGEEFFIGIAGWREKCWYRPTTKKGVQAAYAAAGLMYTVELSEESDGAAFFEVIKLVGTTYVSVGQPVRGKKRRV